MAIFQLHEMAKQKFNIKTAPVTITKSLSFGQRIDSFKAIIFLFGFFLFANSILNKYYLYDELTTLNRNNLKIITTH